MTGSYMPASSVAVGILGQPQSPQRTPKAASEARAAASPVRGIVKKRLPRDRQRRETWRLKAAALVLALTAVFTLPPMVSAATPILFSDAAVAQVARSHPAYNCFGVTTRLRSDGTIGYLAIMCMLEPRPLRVFVVFEKGGRLMWRRYVFGPRSGPLGKDLGVSAYPG